MKGFIIAVFVSLAIKSVWFMEEYKQFGELQWNRDCDNAVYILYFIALWIGFSKWRGGKDAESF